jgi:hypothetical protein
MTTAIIALRRVGLVLLALAALLAAAVPGVRGDDETVVVRKETAVAGQRYQADPIFKALWGPHYRKLWATPIEVEVLDVGRVSGGLTPKKKGGGLQTRSLVFEGADGREWKLRSVDKDPTKTLRPEMQDTVIDSIVQDQISAHHPGAALVSDGLAEAAGIFHPARRLVVVPDDPRLGEFRQEFAGMLAYLEEDPQVKAPVTPGLEGSTDLLETVELWKRLDENPSERVDERLYLKARLFDVFIGDWDRHKDQWDWARFGSLWRPLPKDRDLAFAKFDGFFLAMARPAMARIVDFEKGYPNIVGLAWQARFLDRRHLSGLSWPAWQEVALELQGQLTNEAIEAATRRLPAPWYAHDGARMAEKLRSRRDLLPRVARELYALLADEVEVHGTDRADHVDILRGADGVVEVRMTTDGAERLHRRFLPEETDEVRIYLKGGDDRARSHGGNGPIEVRVAGGAGADTLDDSQGGYSRFYDHEGENRIVDGKSTRDSDKPYETPLDRHGNGLRDWGSTVLKVPWVSAGGDRGVFLGYGLRFIDYGFRKHPYASRQDLRVGYSSGLRGIRAEYEGEFVATNSRKRTDVQLRYSDVDFLRFYGFGNETTTRGDDEFHQVHQRQYTFRTAWRLGFDDVSLSLGPVVKLSTTPTSRGGIIADARPYGVGDFGQAGVSARLAVDSREPESVSGAMFQVEGTYYPRVWDVESAFGEVHGETGVVLGASSGLRPALALRVGGKRVWGEYPFHEAAFIGGPDSIRGLRPQRFAGDASVYGNAELRFRLFRANILVPTDVGVLGLADAGRVFVLPDPSKEWHTAFGGGLWMSFLNRRHTVSLTAASSEGQVRLYFQGGFLF